MQLTIVFRVQLSILISFNGGIIEHTSPQNFLWGELAEFRQVSEFPPFRR
jgi:hypothetical protein